MAKTYTDLQNDIVSWLENDELTAKVTTFISLAEFKINRELRAVEMESIATQALSAVSEFINLPTDNIKLRNLYIDNGGVPKKIPYITPIQMSLWATDANDKDGNPRAYTIIGQQVKFPGIPGNTNNAIFEYIAKEPELSVLYNSNWITNNAYDLILYGSLAEAESWLINDDRVVLWKTMFQEILDKMNTAADEARFSGDDLRMRAT